MEKKSLIILQSDLNNHIDIANQILSIISSQATSLGRFEIIDRNLVTEILAEQKFQLSGMINDENIIERTSGRRVHIASGRNYHVKFNPPKKEGFDDLTGEELIQRDDDKREVVEERLIVYRNQTEPLISFYKAKQINNDLDYLTVDGSGSVESISQFILNFFRNK